MPERLPREREGRFLGGLPTSLALAVIFPEWCVMPVYLVPESIKDYKIQQGLQDFHGPYARTNKEPTQIGKLAVQLLYKLKTLYIFSPKIFTGYQQASNKTFP